MDFVTDYFSFFEFMDDEVSNLQPVQQSTTWKVFEFLCLSSLRHATETKKTENWAQYAVMCLFWLLSPLMSLCAHGFVQQW